MPSSILEHIGNTPMVALRHIGAGLPQPVWVKCEHLNPGGSVKDRIAKAIVEDARRRGHLRDGATLIEATAGNTGIGLALVAAAYGYRLVCVMPRKMSEDKRHALRVLGAEVIVAPNVPPHDPQNFQNLARRLAREHGWYMTEQFENPANIWAHQVTTAEEIWAQTDGKLGALVAGAGTGGTLTGVGRAFRSKGSRARLILADPEGSMLAEWIRSGTLTPSSPFAVEGIGSSEPRTLLDPDVIDGVEVVSDAESFAMTRRLITEEGLLVGGSAGTAVVASLRVAACPQTEGPVVAVLPDSWDRYLGCDWMQTGHEDPEPGDATDD